MNTSAMSTKSFFIEMFFTVSIIFSTLLVVSCGNTDTAAENNVSSSGTGSYSCSISWPDNISSEDNGLLHSSAVDCSETGIDWVTFTFYDENNIQLMEKEFACDLHSGTVDKIPAGSNRRLVVTAADSGGTVLYRGEQTGISIYENQTTYGGEMALEPIDIPTAEDSDSDGVSDYLDHCLDTPEGVEVDVNGCQHNPDECAVNSYFMDGRNVVDGDGSEWSEIQEFEIPSINSILNNGEEFFEPADNDQDCSAIFKTSWDNNYLYVFIQVTDDLIHDDSVGIDEVWEDDGVELYIDGGNERSSAYDDNDIKILIDTENNTYWDSSDEFPYLYATSKMANSYIVEFAVPFAVMSVTPVTGVIIGFDIAVNDDDDGGDREHQIVWSGNGTQWFDPREFGQLALIE